MLFFNPQYYVAVVSDIPVFYDLFIHDLCVFIFYLFICLCEGVKYSGTVIKTVVVCHMDAGS